MWQNGGGYSEGQKRWIWRLANVRVRCIQEIGKISHNIEELKKYKVDGQSYLFYHVP